MAKKLLITKTDTVEHIADVVGAAGDEDVTLVIPRGSRLREQADAFAHLREAARAAGVQLSIESVDEELLARAHEQHLATTHPFFRSDRRTHYLSDIMHPDAGDDGVVPPRTVPVETVADLSQDEVPAEPVEQHTTPDFRDLKHRDTVAAPAGRRLLRRSRFLALLGAAVVVLGAVGAFTQIVLSKATIRVTLTETPWRYEGRFTAATSVASTTGSTIPGQLFVSQKNIAQPFPATGSADGSGTKATGMITIFNAFDTNPQQLVAKTRFITKEGILLRLTKPVTVPPATRSGDKLAPASVDAEVVADAAGEASNLPAGQRLSIPGFAGTPRADGFYGVTKALTGGGATGKKVATDADVEKAQHELENVLASSFKAALIAAQPKGLTIIDGASSVTTQRISANRTTDEQGNFSLFGEAKLKAVAFRERDLTDALLTIANASTSASLPVAFRTIGVKYKDVTPATENGSLTFTVVAEGSTIPALTEAQIRERAQGSTVAEVEAWLRSVGGITDARIRVWPFWRRSIPADGASVTVTLQ